VRTFPPSTLRASYASGQANDEDPLFFFKLLLRRLVSPIQLPEQEDKIVRRLNGVLLYLPLPGSFFGSGYLPLEFLPFFPL